MRSFHLLAFILLIIGGLNWLLYGLFQTDMGAWLGGMNSTIAKIIYILVGLAALLELFTHKGNCKRCGSPSVGGATM